MVGLSSLSLFITRLHLHCWWSNLQSILSHCISICSWVSWVDMPPLDIHQVTNQQSLFSSYYHTWYYDHFTFRVRLSSAKKFCDDGISCANMCKYSAKSEILITCGIITILKKPMNHPTSLLLEKHRRNSPVSSRYYLTLLSIIINGIITIIVKLIK